MQRSKVQERDHVDRHCEQSYSVIPMDASEDIQRQDRKQKIMHLLKKKDLKIEEIKSELDNCVCINTTDKFGNSVLHLAIEKINNERTDHVEFIQFLLNRGADPRLKSAGGYSPFLLAAMKNKVEAMRVLADCKGNFINDITDNGDTALHLAVELDHIEAVVFLHQLCKTHGFKKDIRSKGSHMTPRELVLSKSPRNEKIVKALDGNLDDYNFETIPKERYKMSAIPRGKCHILQNDTFSKLENRVGCNDADRLAETFGRLNFEITKDLNLTACGMLKRIKAFSAVDHSKYDCFVLCISTHGELDAVFGADGKKLLVRHIISEFAGPNCKSLIGKPKLFFISACRNDTGISDQRLDNGKNADSGGIINSISPNTFESGTQRPIGLEDIFEGYSTPYGFTSYRESHSGNPGRCSSSYIDALCDALDAFSSKKEFQQIMLTVNRTVIERGLQVPSPIVRLSKELWFNKTT